MSTGTGDAEGPGDGGPLPRRQAAGSPAGRPLPHGRCSHLFHVVPAGDGGPRDGTLHVEFLPSALSLVSDEPVFLLRPYQRVLKNACQVGSVLGRDSPPLSPRAGRAASHGGAAACGWGTAPGRHAVRYFGTPRRGFRDDLQGKRAPQGPRCWDARLAHVTDEDGEDRDREGEGGRDVFPHVPWGAGREGPPFNFCYF